MPEPADWCGFALVFIVWGSLQTQRPGLESRVVNEAKEPFITYACAPLKCALRYGGCARETLVFVGFCPFARVPARVQLPPLRLEPDGAAETH
jgi:hypothetical protein